MPDPDTITALKRTGSNVQERMSSYLSFAKATLEKYDRASDGGRVPPLAAFLRYDIEVLANALSDPFDFDTLDDYPLSSGQLQGLERMRALCDDVREFYAEGGNHQTEVAEAYKGDHGMTQSEVQRIERSAGVIRRALDPYYSCLDKVLDTNRNDDRWEAFWVDDAGGDTLRIILKRPSISYISKLPFSQLGRIIPMDSGGTD